MLQFDLKVTVNQYMEDSKTREKEFDYTEAFIVQVKEALERTISTSVILSDDNRVFICSLSNIRTVQ